MCGSYGYTGSGRNAALVTLQGLKRVEYRGYDSFGFALVNSGLLHFIKRTGKISEVSEDEFEGINAHASIGHTRWATHGKVTVENAHPHWNTSKTIAVAHNGIIDNHEELREAIENSHGKNIFVSETDTETIVHLIDLAILYGMSFKNAVIEASRKLQGQFSFVVISQNEQSIIGVRSGSPLVFGRETDGHHIASDTIAFPVEIKEQVFLNDREMVVFWPKAEPEFLNIDSGELIERSYETRVVSADESSKARFPHFMLKEITEQNHKLTLALNHDLSVLTQVVSSIQQAREIIMVGCGTAARVAMVGEYLFASARKQTEFCFSSEFARRTPFVTDQTLIIAISQSGETADTIAAIKEAKARGATVVSILNSPNSTIDRLSRASLFLQVGPECAVASTKAATAQILILELLATLLSGRSVSDVRSELERELAKLAPLFEPLAIDKIRVLAESIAEIESMFLIGRDILHPIALEGALKIQEVSYVHALGFAGGELKHGPIALIESGTPCLALAPHKNPTDLLSNCQELRARKARIIGIAPTRASVFDEWIEIPKLNSLEPLAALVPLQILAYYLGVYRGIDPDKPRNLAKSVTVK